jgi:hypothetical protein
MSIREASRHAKISYGRWRQITSGYQNVSPGVYAQVKAPAATVARMAQAVGVTPEQLEAEGDRPDAAAILRKTLSSQAGADRPLAGATLLPLPSRRPPDDDGFIRPQYEPSLEEFAREQERLRPDVSHRDIAYAVDVKYLGQLYAESQERIRELEAELARKETENERLRGDLKRAHLRVTG